MISLEAVRARSGDRWPRKREQVEAFVERAFVRIGGPGVLVAALNDVEFLSIQPEVRGLKALGQSAAVLKETLSFFLGRIDREDVRIFQVIDHAAGELTVEAVDSARWLGNNDEASAPELTGSTRDPDIWPASGAAPLLREIERGPARTPRLVLQGKPELAVSYTVEPIWNIGQQVVASYLMQPTVYLTSSSRIAEPSRFAAEQLVSVGVDQAAARIIEGAARGLKFALHLPIPFLGVASASARYRAQRHLADLPPEVRRLLVLDLTGIAEGLPHGRMAETVAALAPVCRAVLARAPSPTARLSQWRNSHLAGVSLDCSALDPDDPHSMARMTGFTTAAAQVSKTVIGYGLASRSLTLAAWAAGFTHVTGAAVQPDAPLCALRWDAADLYRETRR